jgi:replicative DNA helicase
MINEEQSVLINNLNPTRSIYTVIGILMNAPQTVRNPEMPLNDMDFYQSFHKNIFAAIYNIAYSDSKIDKVTPIDIDNFIAQYPANYKIWEQHDGFNYVTSAMENANMRTYKQNYWRLKKFAMLRDYVSNGVDVSSIYDYRLDDLAQQADQMKALDKMTIDDMVDHFSLKMLGLRDRWSIGEKRVTFSAGDGLDTLLDRLAEEPEMGYPFRNGFYNAIFRGMREKKFMLRSAGTGVGKTRLSIADITNAAVDEIWCYKEKKYIQNGPSQAGLFISTELEKDELQTGILAYVSGVDEDVIKNGRYSADIKQRLLYAIEIIKRAPIHAEYIDDFSIADIETIIEQHIIDNNVKYIAFDYIQMVPKLARTMQEAFAGSLREDQILVQLSSALKLLANKYGVYIVSSTQLNRNAKEHEMRDTNSLRGGSATADKVDYGIMVFRVTQKDLDNLKHIIERNYDMKPNFCHYVYKNRGNSKVGVIIWTRYNGGTIREEELFVTDLDFNQIDVENLHVEFEEVAADARHNKFIDEHMDGSLEEMPEF